jgi:hypothetical protein
MRFAVPFLTLVALIMPSIAAVAEQSPADAYMEIRKQEASATSYKDFCKFRTTRSIKKDKPFTPDEEKMMVEMIKMMAPKKVDIVKVDTAGDEATIHATAPSEDPKEITTGTITMLKENGVWKLDHEKWSTKSGDVPDGSASAK